MKPFECLRTRSRDRNCPRPPLRAAGLALACSAALLLAAQSQAAPITSDVQGADKLGNGDGISVKSLSGPPAEFASKRLPSVEELMTASNILVLDQRRIEPGTTRSLAERTSHSSFSVTEGNGFSLVQVTSDYPNFSSATIFGPGGTRYYFDGASITCNSGPCDQYQADLVMEPFDNRPGGTVAFSISGGEVVSSTSWNLEMIEPVPTLRTMQFDSVIAYDENYVDVGIDPDPSPGPTPIPDPGDPCDFCIEPMLEMVEGGAPVLALGFSRAGTEAKPGSGETVVSGREPQDGAVVDIEMTITNADTREVVHRDRIGVERAAILPRNAHGHSLLQLPALGAGLHSVRLDVTADLPGQGVIERTVLYPLMMLEARYGLTGATAARVLDESRLEIELGLDVRTPVPGHLYAYAEVWVRGGRKPIAWIGGMTHPRGERENAALPLVFDARWMALADVHTGGLELRNVRIQDPDTFVPYDQIPVLPLTADRLPSAASAPRSSVRVDDTLYFGKGDITIPRPAGLEPVQSRTHPVPDGILLVHGWCSGGNPWPEWQFNDGPTREFADFSASRSHDSFAQRIRDQGNANFTNQFAIVAHSQGGAASTHLRAFYNSRLDNSTAPRRIQSMGTPYGGSILMDYYVATGPLGWLIGWLISDCAPSFSLSTVGSALWRNGIPNSVRSQVYFYRTRHNRPSNFWQRLQFWRWNCKISSYVIPSSDDGVVSHREGRFSNARSMGITDGECHTGGMKHTAQYLNSSRNAIMDREGRPPPPPPLVARCQVDSIWRSGGPTGNGYYEYWADASGSTPGQFPISTYQWTISGQLPGSPTTTNRIGPFFPGLPGQASSYTINVVVRDTAGNSDGASCYIWNMSG